MNLRSDYLLRGMVSPPSRGLSGTVSPIHLVSDGNVVPAKVGKVGIDPARLKADLQAEGLRLWSLREAAILDTLHLRGTAHTCSSHHTYSGCT